MIVNEVLMSRRHTNKDTNKVPQGHHRDNTTNKALHPRFAVLVSRPASAQDINTSQMNYQQQAPPPRKSGGGGGCMTACLAALCCCCVAEEGCEACADCAGASYDPFTIQKP
jgi:hypothetical protein